MDKRASTDERFNSRLRRDGDCLLWTGAVHHNVDDRQTRGRQVRGELVATARLDVQRVRDIRAALAAGETVAALSARYGVGVHTIRGIRSGRTWKHV